MQHRTQRVLCSPTLVALALLAGLLFPLAPAAQQPDRAREIFDRVIVALGGQAYLNVRDISQQGRLYNFTDGALASPGERFKNFVKFPSKQWIEYGKKGKIVYLNNGDEGWELDRQGVNDQTPEAVENFQEGNKRDFEYLLRFRVREEKMQLYYLGREFVDNLPAYIIELVDSESESYKLYVNASTYLPMQLRYTRYSELRQGRVKFVEYYGKYVDIQGIQTPMHMSRERDGQRNLEVFFEDISYNSLDDSFFTRAALEARWKKVK